MSPHLGTFFVFDLLLLAAIVHVFEEFIFPGGFGREFKEMFLKVDIEVTNGWLIFTNIMFLGGVVFARLSENTFFAYTMISVAFINGLLHIGKSIQVGRYFPGLISASLMYVPLGSFSVISLDLSPASKVLGILIGATIHAFPLLILAICFRQRAK